MWDWTLEGVWDRLSQEGMLKLKRQLRPERQVGVVVCAHECVCVCCVHVCMYIYIFVYVYVCMSMLDCVYSCLCVYMLALV